jgi:murein DD-endopeptidase MepM/ murein hydrolase activator NlpD
MWRLRRALVAGPLLAWCAAASAQPAKAPRQDNAPPSGLEPSPLVPPLDDMKVRWDGTRVEASGMKSFDSPRFGMTRDGGGRAHTGLDLDAPVGTPVFAVADGVIDLARYGDALYGADILLAFRPTQAILTYLERTGAGDDDGVLFAHYAHLSAVFVETGQRVGRGTMIGRTGATGNADQKYPHLHFEVRKTRWPGIGLAGLRNRIDPESLFKVDFSTPVEAATPRKP